MRGAKGGEELGVGKSRGRRKEEGRKKGER